MPVIEFKDVNCKNCYRCLRECPVKAIKVTDHGAEIIEEYCIQCGNCILACQQGAKVISSNLNEVLELINSGKKVVASVAPSFIANFNVSSFNAFKKALKELGFYDCYETAEGAHFVTEEYKKVLDSKKYSNLISTACPSIVSLVAKYYPNAIKYLAPVDSPMVAHAKMLHERFDEDINVVFIGPCIAKIREAKEANKAYNRTLIDGVITFNDLNNLFIDNNITFDNDIVDDKDNIKSRNYAVNRGVCKAFSMYHPDYEYISIDGIENAMHVLDNIDDLSGVFFEMSSCDFSCVNGPASTFNNKAVIKSVEKVRKYARNRYDKDKDHSLNYVDISTEFKKQDITYLTPSEYEIQEILKKINKTKKEHELNCGACGYQTCRAKAAAVYNGLSNIYTCLPYMNDLAEKMNEEVIHYSPNGIITFDEDNNIININDKAKEMFGITTPEVSLGYFRDYLPWDDLSLGFINQKNVIEKESYIEKTKKYVEYSLVFVKQNKMSFCLLRDITIHKEYEKQLNQNQKELINTTNTVIEKQMRVVQEIASLLGETTAETKVALIKLRDQFVNKDGE